MAVSTSKSLTGSPATMGYFRTLPSSSRPTRLVVPPPMISVTPGGKRAVPTREKLPVVPSSCHWYSWEGLPSVHSAPPRAVHRRGLCLRSLRPHWTWSAGCCLPPEHLGCAMADGRGYCAPCVGGEGGREGVPCPALPSDIQALVTRGRVSPGRCSFHGVPSPDNRSSTIVGIPAASSRSRTMAVDRRAAGSLGVAISTRPGGAGSDSPQVAATRATISTPAMTNAHRLPLAPPCCPARAGR